MTARLASIAAAAALLFLVAVGTMAASWEEIQTRRDFAVFPPPGRLVPVDGGVIHLHCIGTGRPTVVISAGTGVLSVQWASIQRQVATRVRVCTWDRRGLAWSQPRRDRPTAARAAEDLFNVLTAADETGPWIMVGESYGGYLVRLFHELHPNDVAAMVLVESAHPRQWDTIPATRELLRSARPKLQVALWLGRFGILRWMTADRGLDLPEDVRPALLAFQAHTATVDAVLAEIDGVSASASDVLKAPALASLPLVVVSAGRSLDRFFPSAPPSVLQTMNHQWMALQNDLCALSTNCVHLTEPAATHNIARERPDVVVAAIGRALGLASGVPNRCNPVESKARNISRTRSPGGR